MFGCGWVEPATASADGARFVEEPLPAANPFWDLPNVIITPHLSAISPVYLDRAVKLFADNLSRYIADKPLLTPIDKVRGY